MISVDSPYEPVTVVIPSGPHPRYGAFELAMHGLHVPRGSALARARGSNPAKNRNEAIRHSDTPWFFFIDDDHVVPEDTVLRLLAHNKDIVCALVTTKLPPLRPVLFKGERPHPEHEGRVQWISYPLAELDGHRGLFGPIHAGPGSGILIRREVLACVGDPWFEVGQEGNTEELHEDFSLWRKIRAVGAEVYVDLDTRLGHWDSSAVSLRQFPDGTWRYAVTWENGEAVLLNRVPEHNVVVNAPVVTG